MKGNLSIIIFARVPVHNWIFVAILVFSFSYLYIVYIIETKSILINFNSLLFPITNNLNSFPSHPFVMNNVVYIFVISALFHLP